jgi:hypothetical protein
MLVNVSWLRITMKLINRFNPFGYNTEPEREENEKEDEKDDILLLEDSYVF